MLGCDHWALAGSPEPQMVVFCDFIGVGIGPLPKKLAVKCIWSLYNTTWPHLFRKTLCRLFDKSAIACTEHDALVKSTTNISSNFVAFSENTNLKCKESYGHTVYSAVRLGHFTELTRGLTATAVCKVDLSHWKATKEERAFASPSFTNRGEIFS